MYMDGGRWGWMRIMMSEARFSRDGMGWDGMGMGWQAGKRPRGAQRQRYTFTLLTCVGIVSC